MQIHLKPLAEQVVVITGASSGIGLATARLAAARGARLVLAARSAAALGVIRDDLGARGADVVAVVADVAHEDQARHIAEVACTTFGGFDSWVNNAGVSVYGRCLDVDTPDLERVLATNLWGTVHGSRAACAHLVSRGGALINVGSAVSDRAVPLQGIYSASKHAIKGWTDALRVELAHAGAPVSVTLVKPGPIDTPYAQHAANYLGTHPVHVPPVYSVASAARAILYAAEHPVRDVYVGSTARLIGLLSAVAPSLVDTVMQHVFIDGTQSGRPPGGRSILFEPAEDPQATGDYPGLVRASVYTEISVRPALLATVGALAAGALSLTAWSRMRRGDRAPHSRRRTGGSMPNDRRSTARAAQ
jgi:short-subunit dehydrogenase